jgi:predicted transcriptional regulator of viral defense system
MRGLDRIVASIASRQHGARRTTRQGNLIRVYRGVYRVGHSAPSMEARYMAAVLACGDGAVLSGRAAACLLGLIRAVPEPDPEVTAPKDRRIRGVTTHRERGGVDDAMVWKAIPVTTPARTLVDLAASASVGELTRAVHEAGIGHDTGPEAIDAVLERRPNSKGAAALRAVLYGDQGRTLSTLEREFLTLLRRARLPLPRHESPGGRPPGRLSLAGAEADRGARLVPLPPIASRLGARPRT